MVCNMLEATNKLPIGILELGQKMTNGIYKKANPFFYSLSDEEKEFVNGIAMQLPISCEDVAKIFIIRGNGNKEITKRFLYTEYGFIIE